MNRREFLKSVAVVCAASSSQASPFAAPGTTLSTPSGPGLPQRTLGKTGVQVSAVALGGVIGMQFLPSPDHDPVGLAETALDLGITYFDSAPSYNNGQSETNYGHVMARRRKEVFLATKCEGRTYDGAMRGLEESLKRLQTDHVDLIQIHNVQGSESLDAWEKPDGVLTALRKLRDQKMTRFIGVTGHDNAAKLREAIERFDFDTLLTTLNPVSRRKPFREELLPIANRKQMGVIAMKLMGGGNGCLVTGNPMQKVIQPYHDQTPNQVLASSLVRYTLSLPISVAVIGVASIEQLKANLRTVRESTLMTQAERQILETAIG